MILPAPLPTVYADLPAHHVTHLKRLGRGQTRENRAVLAAVDEVQARAMDGGGYFVGVKADPPESPLGYDATFLGHPMLKAPRTTSYCSGGSYGVLLAALSRLLKGRDLGSNHRELWRMQEPDGGRREDGVKAWGWWNADGPGCHYALVDYTGVGRRVPFRDARPGDFMNVSWKSGLGHSTVFLGTTVRDGKPMLAMWSSQKGTNGYGDLLAPYDDVAGVVVVRLTSPERALGFTPSFVNKKIEYDGVTAP